MDLFLSSLTNFFFFIKHSSYLLSFPMVGDPLKGSLAEKVDAPGIDICSH